MGKLNLIFKRLFDIIASLIGLIVLIPLLTIISVMIKMDSQGPIFFFQERLGLNGRVFKIIKFRTMVIDAEKTGSGIKISSKNDERITRIGKFLRSTSLDEIPQLINVIKGEMSLVGPRPPVIYHPYRYNDYSDFQKKRFLMRPGITGLVQIRVRNSVPWEKRIIIDVEYIKKFNVYLDLIILIKTLINIFKKENIYKS